MNRKNLLKLSLISIICAIVVFIIAYFFFHFVTDSGITLTWHAEPGKPFVSYLIGTLGVLFTFASATYLTLALTLYGKDK